jgi:hypothetical protein
MSALLRSSGRLLLQRAVLCAGRAGGGSASARAPAPGAWGRPLARAGRGAAVTARAAPPPTLRRIARRPRLRPTTPRHAHALQARRTAGRRRRATSPPLRRARARCSWGGRRASGSATPTRCVGARGRRTEALRLTAGHPMQAAGLGSPPCRRPEQRRPARACPADPAPPLPATPFPRCPTAAAVPAQRGGALPGEQQPPAASAAAKGRQAAGGGVRAGPRAGRRRRVPATVQSGSGKAPPRLLPCRRRRPRLAQP